MKLNFFFLLLFHLFGVALSAQKPDIVFVKYDVNNGLSQNSVTVMHQDRNGFMWFGTQDGLNRFDGKNFVHFRTERDNPNSLSNNYIWDLYEDGEGYLWIATFGGGLNKMNPATGSIERYQYNKNEKNPFLSNRVFSITQTQDGFFWIGANEGLLRFNKNSGQTQRFLDATTNEGVLLDHYIGTVAADKTDAVWLRTDNGLARFQPNTTNVEYFNDSPFVKSHPTGEINHIVSQGDYILVAAENGLYKINTNSKSGELLLAANRFYAVSETFMMRNVLPIHEHIFVIGTSHGLLIYDAKTDTAELYQSGSEDAKSLSHDHILSLHQSKDGVIWVGTRNGLNKIETLTPDFVHIRNFNGPKSQQLINVNGIVEKNDSIFFISTTDGLYRYNNNTHIISHLSDAPENQKIFTTRYFLGLFEDSKGNTWVATRNGGFYKIDTKNKVTKIAPVNQNAATLRVHNIKEDSRGNLWIGTGGQGLWRYSPKTNTVKVYPYNKDGSGLSHPFVFAFLEDKHKNIWIGTPTGGLNLYDYKTEKFIYLNNDPSDPGSLSNDIILSLHEDSNNNLWIGSSSGLNKLKQPLSSTIFETLKNNATSLFKRISQEDGLPNEVIYGILEDDAQQLWISTNKGLVQLDMKTETVKQTFDASHGLQSNEFNQNGYFKAKSGSLYFGGVNGITVFHPEQVKGNTYVPDIVFTGLSIFNRAVKVGVPDEVIKFKLDSELYSTDQLTLSWKHNVFSIDFAGLSYVSPEKNTYSYTLEGFNENWLPVGPLTTATYTNLDPGDYTFKVKAANNSGLWNETGRMLKIHITAPPWKRWYAYLFYGILFLTGIYAYVKYRTQMATQEIKRHMELEQVRIQEREAFRKRSSQDFHDEAGNKITRIALVTELAKQQVSKDNQLKDYLRKIEENVQELNTGMRDFIWALDPGKDTLQETLIRFEDFATDFCEEAGVGFKSEYPSETFSHVMMNMNERRHLLMMLKECLNNSIKHAAPKQILFKVTQKEQQITISLTDDGKGFDVDKIAAGQGLNNLKERAKAIQAGLDIRSDSHNGTCVSILIKPPVRVETTK